MTPRALTALWFVVVVPVMTAVLWVWLVQQQHATAADLQRGRVNALEGRAAQLELDVDAIPPAAPVADVDALRAELAQANRRIESLCLALATVARTSTGSERLAGDTEWCPVSMPKRVGEGRGWRKHGWELTDAEAAAIRARIAGGAR